MIRQNGFEQCWEQLFSSESAVIQFTHAVFQQCFSSVSAKASFFPNSCLQLRVLIVVKRVQNIRSTGGCGGLPSRGSRRGLAGVSQGSRRELAAVSFEDSYYNSYSGLVLV